MNSAKDFENYEEVQDVDDDDDDDGDEEHDVGREDEEKKIGLVGKKKEKKIPTTYRISQ